MPDEDEFDDIDAIVDSEEASRHADFMLGMRFPDKQSPRGLGSLLRCLDDLYYDIHGFSSWIDSIQPDSGQSLATEAATLTIRVLHIHSPGWLEIIGSLNPLKWIYDYTKLWLDHYAATGTRKLTQEEFQLKNQELMLSLLTKEIEVMKKAGYSKKRIQEAIDGYLEFKVGAYGLAVQRVQVEEIYYELLPDNEQLPKA